MRFLIFALLLAASPVAFSQDFAPPPTQEYGDRLDRIYDATVRVSVSGGTGTGTIFKEDDKFYYILTNAHVATANRVGLEFTKNHYPSPRYQGEVTFRVLRSGVDVAVVRVAKSALPAGINLPVIPLASSDEVVKELFLVTSGCQAGERPSIQNTITTRDTNNLIYYLPTSRPGRSGSALVSRDGKTIQGLVAWMTDQGPSSEGLAMKIDVIRPLIEGQNVQVAMDDFPLDAVEIPLASGEFVETEAHVLSNCPADSCLDDNCPWDLEYVSTFPAKDDPWRRRFGGPQSPQPQQPAPQQPQAPTPGNPWSSPQQPAPQQPAPQQPQQPSPQQPAQPERERPRLFDSEREFGKLFERFDKLEPKLDRLEKDVQPIAPKLNDLLNRNEDDEVRQRLLFNRLNQLPDELAKQQDRTIREGFGGAIRNFFWELVRPFVWAWWIAVIIGILFVLNQFLPMNYIIPMVFGLIFSFIGYAWQGILNGVAKLMEMRAEKNQPKPVKKPRKPRAKKPVEKVDE